MLIYYQSHSQKASKYFNKKQNKYLHFKIVLIIVFLMDFFVWPFVAFILPLPLLIWLMLPHIHKMGKNIISDALRVPFFNRVSHLTHHRRLASGKLIAIPMILAWICFVSAAMRPVRYEDELPAFHEAYNIMMAIDLSTSMARKDFDINGISVSRIDVVKNVVRDFINKRSGDRLGMVIFGSNAYTLAPLSQDLKTLDELFRDVDLGIAGEQTAIGDALALAVQDIAKIPKGKRVIILLSDGYNNAGSLLVSQAIELAKKQNIEVYTIGIGSARQNKTSFLGLLGGNDNTGWDEITLKKIAKETNGKYFRARSTKDLVDVYQEIDRLETTTVENQGFKPKKELFYYPLLAGLIFWLLAQQKRMRS
jgi:Ca-activated chloride channel family protein